MREYLKAYMQKHPGIFNPMWERIYPLIRRGDGEIFLRLQRQFRSVRHDFFRKPLG